MAPLDPGVYKTTPYSCLVLVPAPHVDDRCIIGSGRAGAEAIQMPTVKPGLDFQPFSAVK